MYIKKYLYSKKLAYVNHCSTFHELAIETASVATEIAFLELHG
jgi:hypothetical protein